MNNFVILLAAIATGFIAYLQCYNDEDMALFFLAMLIVLPSIFISFVGICIGKNFFEC